LSIASAGIAFNGVVSLRPNALANASLTPGLALSALV
jgi:hypothetical protein